jgi:hypothetical protein
MVPQQITVLLYAILLTLTACTESAGFRPVTPRTLPNHVRLPGLSTVRVGERFNSKGFVRLLPSDTAFPTFFQASPDNPVYQPASYPRDSLEKTWIVMRHEKVRCVMMQRRQSYRQALDSLTVLLGNPRPVWTDSSSSHIQTVWDDGYVTWWVGGHWHPGVYPVTITVMTADPVGRTFSLSPPDLC